MVGQRMHAFFLLALLAVASSAQSVPLCTWLFPAYEGVPLNTFLSPNWNGTSCPGLLSFVPQNPIPAGFTFPNLHNPNFTFTPPIGQNNYQLQVSVAVTCSVVLKWCNPGVIYFWVYPSGLTPAPTAAPSTAVPTPLPTAAPTAVPTPQPTPLPPGLTQGPTPVPPTAAPPTPVPTPVPTPQIPVTCQNPPVAYSYIQQPVRLDILAGVQNCLSPSLSVVQDPANPAMALWSVNATDGNTLYFDAAGTNTVQAVFSVSVNVQCASVTYCILPQQLIVSAPLTPAPTPAPLVIPDCPPAYGFQGFYGQTLTYSLSTQDFAFQCAASLGSISFLLLSNTTLGTMSAFDSSSGNFTYSAPTTVAIDRFTFSISCGGAIACNGQAFVVTTMNPPATTAAPTTASLATSVPPGMTGAPPTAISTPVPLGTNAPQWQPCPGASPFIFPFFRNADQSFSLQSANLLTGVNLSYACSAYANVTLLSNPVVGQLAGFTSQTGQFWYTTQSAVNGWDNFTFALTCASPTPFTCVATAMIIIFPAPNAPTPAPTPMPTLPLPFNSINQGTIQCRGTCDADAWKSTDLYPNMFDVTPDYMGTYTQVTPRKDGNPLDGASYSLSPTANNVLVITFYSKIGNMAARFPTFLPFDVPDRTPFNSAAAAGTGAAFNASCLDLQKASGVAYAMWAWDDPQLRNLSGRIVNNSYYSRGNDYFQKFGGKHKSCDAFLANSCQYAPLLTPNIPSAGALPQNNFVNWTLTVDDCDATWVGTVTLDAIKSMTYPNGTKIFTRTAPKQLSGLMYSEVIKPIKWIRGTSGTTSLSTPVPVSVIVRTYLTAGAVQIDSVAPVQLSAAPTPTQTGSPPLPTSVPSTLVATAAPSSGSSSGTSFATNGPTTATSPLATAGSGSATTSSPLASAAPLGPPTPTTSGPTATATPNVSTSGASVAPTPATTVAVVIPPVPANSSATPLVNVSVDIEYSITANPWTNERQYMYNVLLFPLPAIGNSSSLFVSNVQLVSASFTNPTAAQCPMCTGNVSTCYGTGTGFADSCGASALVTFAPNPAAPVWCPNTTSPLLSVPGVAGPRSCPQKLFNVSFFGTVSGANSATVAGQPEGTIVINITLSNGQVFQVQLVQTVYLSQASSSPDLGVTINRPTAYFTVVDPLGTSLPTKQWTVPKPDAAPSDWGFPVASSTLRACPVRFSAPTTDFFSSLPNGAASMTDLPDARIFGPTDWVFTQINTNVFPNATLNFLTLTVDASEVVPRPTQQQFSFLLTGSNPPPATPAQGGVYLDWSTYASFISFRAVDNIGGKRAMQFALVPGALLRTGCSNTVIFKLEASVSVGSATYFIRLLVPVSQSARRDSGSLNANFFGAVTANIALLTASSRVTWIIYVLIVGALVLATFAAASYYDKTLLPSLALQWRILLAALHITTMPVPPEPPLAPAAFPKQRDAAPGSRDASAKKAGGAAQNDGQRGAAPPMLLTVTTGAQPATRKATISGGPPSSPAKFGVIQEETLPRRDEEEA